MKKSLIIVESPTKIKTLRKYLPCFCKTISSMGHILDLPKNRIGIKIKNTFLQKDNFPIYKKFNIIKNIIKSSKCIKHIYIASDPDREGESIAINIFKLLKFYQIKKIRTCNNIYRVYFNELTNQSIKYGFQYPNIINIMIFNAQKIRRIIDRIIGYYMSPILWKYLTNKLSAGRVQSVAIRLIIDREQKITAFIKTLYWTININIKINNSNYLNADLIAYKNKDLRIVKDIRFINYILKDIKTSSCNIKNIITKKMYKKPNPPFTTSTLQQEASKKLNLSVKKIMLIAQKLYEGLKGLWGLITYIRTDSNQINIKTINKLRLWIKEKYGNHHIPITPNFFTLSPYSHEAHEAIRPTFLKYNPTYIKSFLTIEEFKLYELIWNRFIASQMKPIISQNKKIILKCKDYIFMYKNSKIIDKGYINFFYKDYFKNKFNSSKILNVNQKDNCCIKNIFVTQHNTQAPIRYNEGSLIKILEYNDIGRASTYSNIISIIQERQYIKKTNKILYPLQIGKSTNEILLHYFSQIINISFTAGIENNLDKIEMGYISWEIALNSFYKSFKQILYSSNYFQKYYFDFNSILININIKK